MKMKVFEKDEHDKVCVYRDVVCNWDGKVVVFANLAHHKANVSVKRFEKAQELKDAIFFNDEERVALLL